MLQTKQFQLNKIKKNNKKTNKKWNGSNQSKINTFTKKWNKYMKQIFKLDQINVFIITKYEN